MQDLVDNPTLSSTNNDYATSWCFRKFSLQLAPWNLSRSEILCCFSEMQEKFSLLRVLSTGAIEGLFRNYCLFPPEQGKQGNMTCTIVKGALKLLVHSFVHSFIVNYALQFIKVNSQFILYTCGCGY